MPYFGESPLERIVDVHWKKKKDDDPNPGDDNNPPYCGRYGWGATATDFLPAPFGPNQFVPMVGTFSTTKNDPVYGGLGSNSQMLNPVETMTAYSYAQHAAFILLQSDNMVLSNLQLNGIVDKEGQLGRFVWTVPMAYGQSPDGRVMVVKSYTINMAWALSFPMISPLPGEYGLGMSHPLTSPGEHAVVPPPEPFMIVGSMQGGASSYTYDFKWKEWFTNRNLPDEGNQFDPDLGGNAVLWWMRRTRGTTGDFGPWFATSEFMGITLIVPGDWYTWEIIAHCQPMPDWWL